MSITAEDDEPTAMEEPDGPRRPVKSAAAFRTISEVADEIAVPQHVLRFWETKFPQIRPLKRGGGRRYYRPEDVELLRHVAQLLYQEGYTIKGVQRLLREGVIKTPTRLPDIVETLPLGFDDPEPPVEATTPDPPVRADSLTTEPVTTNPLATNPPRVTDPAARAVLRAVLDDLLDISDLLPRRDD
jgi:DNA-binding transcriptional MerR regulator